jgi:diacylglycerol kinase family enzyme
MTQISENTTIGLFKVKSKNAFFEKQGVFVLALTITSNNQTINCLARMVVIANSKKYGTGVVINPNGEMDDGKFELIILKKLDLPLFGKIIMGNMPMDSDDIVIISTDAATVTTNIPVSFQVDGEYIGQETILEIKILHKQIKVTIA